MYTGTLIEELMGAVERTERRILAERSDAEKLAYWYSVSQSELAQFESKFLGVA